MSRRRVSDTQRVVQFFLTGAIADVQAALVVAQEIVRSRTAPVSGPPRRGPGRPSRKARATDDAAVTE